MNLQNLKRRMAFILALTIPLNLAGCKGNEDKESEETQMIVEETIKGITPNELTTFLANISDITPVYNLEEIYLSEDELDAIIFAKDKMEECSNTEYDIKELYNSILQNSTDSRGLITIKDQGNISKEELSSTVKEAIKASLASMYSAGYISVEDACVLKDFRVEIGKTPTGSCMHYNSSAKLLIVDYQEFIKHYDNLQIEALRANVIKEGLIRYLEYGLNYARLQACDCRKEKGQANETIAYGEVLNVLERMATSTSSIYDLGDINTDVFRTLSYDANYNASVLLLLSMFKENRSIEDLNKAIFDCNLQGVYDFFGLETREEIEEFYKIAKTIDVLTENTGYEEQFYRESMGISTTDFRNHIGYAYKASIFKTSVSDLMKYLANNKDLTKEEAMYLYKFVKSIIVNQAYTKTDGRDYEYDPEYVNNIIGIETIYFEFLSKFYGLTIEEVDKLYEDCYKIIGLEYRDTLFGIDDNRLINKFPLLEFIAAGYSPFNSYNKKFDESTGRK